MANNIWEGMLPVLDLSRALVASSRMRMDGCLRKTALAKTILCHTPPIIEPNGLQYCG